MNFSSDPINNLENLIAKNNTKSISIYLLVIITIITVLACLPIIKIDISSQSRGIIRSKQDNVPLSTIVYGKIININLKNNQIVHLGDTLLVVAQEGLQSEKSLNDSLLAHANRELSDIHLILSNNTSNIHDPFIKESYRKYIAQKQELESKVEQAQQNHERYEGLYKKNVIAKVEYETYVYNLRFTQQAINSFIKQQQTEWQSQKHQLEEQIQNLETKSTQIDHEKSNYVMTSPISGTLENIMGFRIGSFVNASQTLGTISPNDNLIVENTVNPNDIGLLKVGQSVKFQLDAFNYNQWGMIEGKVVEIDKNITLTETAAFFKVRCSLMTKHLKLKNGYETSISKGMTLTTRYIIARRSLYELLFDKVDDWLNPKLIE